MKRGLFLLALTAVILINTNAFADSDPNFYVFLYFGQSNMESGGRMDASDKTVDERFLVMADFDNESRGWKKDNWYHAVPPITAKGTGVNLVDYFGETMCTGRNKIIAILPEVLQNSYVISSAGCKTNDHMHFNTEGYKVFGARYAKQMLKLLGYEIKKTEDKPEEKTNCFLI